MTYKALKLKNSEEIHVYKIENGKATFHKSYKNLKTYKAFRKRESIKEAYESIGLTSYRNSQGKLCWE